MTLDEYEIMFLKERAKKQEREKEVNGVLLFVLGVFVGQFIVMTAIALFSIGGDE